MDGCGKNGWILEKWMIDGWVMDGLMDGGMLVKIKLKLGLRALISKCKDNKNNKR